MPPPSRSAALCQASPLLVSIAAFLTQYCIGGPAYIEQPGEGSSMQTPTDKPQDLPCDPAILQLFVAHAGVCIRLKEMIERMFPRRSKQRRTEVEQEREREKGEHYGALWGYGSFAHGGGAGVCATGCYVTNLQEVHAAACELADQNRQWQGGVTACG